MRVRVGPQAENTRTLALIKALHTLVWAIFAGCIVAIPFAGATGHFGLAALLSGLVLVECAVLLFNRFRCPLTDFAGRYTADRRANFDIFLPEWLARNNKTIFGVLFVVGELFLLVRWLTSGR